MRPRPVLLAGVAALLAAALYVNTVPGPFLNDDTVEIRDNPRVHTISGIPALFVSDFWAGGAGGNPLYRPLTAAVTTLIYAAGDGRPAPFHLWVVSLHAAASALAVLLCLGLGLSPPAAVVAGLLFAAHPVHTEAVGWISGQAEVMMTVFLLAAWLAHAGRKTITAVCFLALALLSKETAVVFPLLVVAGDLLGAGPPPQRPAPPGPGERMRAVAVYATAVVAYLGVRYAVLGHVFGGGTQAQARELLNPLAGEPAAVRALTSLKILTVALGQSLWPSSLCIDYGYNQIPIAASLLEPRVLLGGAVVVGACVLLWLSYNRPVAARTRFVALGAIVFLAAWLPVSNLFFPGISIFAERNLYLPLLGFCLAAGALLASPGWLRVVAGIAIVLCGIRTMMRNVEFLDPVAYHAAGTQACPQSAGARYWHGLALREAGRLDEALAQDQAALAIAPQFADARGELGLTLYLMGRDAEAERDLKTALELRPSDWRARATMADIYARTGRVDEALNWYARLAEEQPRNIDLLGNLGATLLDAGRADEARVLFTRLLTEEPASAVGPVGLGGIQAQEGRWDLAVESFAEAVRREPRNANALFNQAQALLRLGRREEAIAVLERGLAQGVRDPGISDLLAQLRASQ